VTSFIGIIENLDRAREIKVLHTAEDIARNAKWGREAQAKAAEKRARKNAARARRARPNAS
jgi:hypothetical protein